MVRITFGIAAAALLIAAAPVDAQQPLGRPLDPNAAACPAPDLEDGIPVEIRIAGRLIRAQVRDTGSDREGARVDVRLVGCEAQPGTVAPADPDAAARDRTDAAAADSPLLRLLHDLRVGLELGPTEDGRCIRARFAIQDRLHGEEAGSGALAPRSAPDRPKDFEICGFPFGIGGEDRPQDEARREGETRQ